MTADQPTPGAMELKPCPFCGAAAVVREHEYGGYFRACCTGCGTFSRWLDTEADAIAAWNRRTLSPPGITREEIAMIINPWAMRFEGYNTYVVSKRKEALMLADAILSRIEAHSTPKDNP